MSKFKKLTITNNDGYYFPLVNMKGIVSSITPFFSGDLKKGYYNYALKPTSEMDLFNLTDKRNVLFFIDKKRYDLNGQLEHQQNDQITYEIKQLAQRVVRTNDKFSIDTLSFVPVDDSLEVHKITLTNITDKPFSVSLVTAFPFYSRSPENIFDHRHVTSLLNVGEVLENGIINKPTLSFDERGHTVNGNYYSFFAFSKNLKPNRYLPVLDEYLNGGTYLFPKGLDANNYQVGSKVAGYEVIGSIGFEEVTLNPQAEISIVLTMGIHDNKQTMIDESYKYQDLDYVDYQYTKVLEYYKKINSYIKFNLKDDARTNQLDFVTLQPILRRYLGNSYLPHHDYGKGGRGWRDLWQDLLALIFSNDNSVKESIFHNFAGVRIDGSNATIIGVNLGEFKADRNKIVRVWSDHGAWPLLTVKSYIDETGDVEILFDKQTYFYDQFTHYTKKTNDNISDSGYLKVNNANYFGTIFEHLLLQNIIGFLNTGKKGFTRLEDADWNDGLDMANQNGETVSFTFFYLNNLRVIIDLLNNIKSDDVEIFSALNDLVLNQITLNEYFDLVSLSKGLDKKIVNKKVIISALEALVLDKLSFIDKHAIINKTHYHSYVNNDGLFLDNNDTVALTSQAMALLNNIPSNEFASKIAAFTKEKLYDSHVGGYRLNSNYQNILTNMGRAYGFAYGNKENGAVFSHMTIMYTYGLYNYNLVTYGSQSINTLLDQALDTKSGVLAGIPEYFNDKGVGKYLYLTGSASWLIKLLREQIFGIKFNYGKLSFEPKLTKDDFNNGVASISTYLFGHLRTITYVNNKGLDYGKYYISKIMIDDKQVFETSFNQIKGNVEVYLDEIN